MNQDLENINHHPAISTAYDFIQKELGINPEQTKNECYQKLRTSATYRIQEDDLIGKVYQYVLQDYLSYGDIFGRERFDNAILEYASLVVEVLRSCLIYFTPVSEDGTESSFYGYLRPSLYRKISMAYASDYRASIGKPSIGKTESIIYAKIKKYCEKKGKNLTPDDVQKIVQGLNLSEVQITAILHDMNTTSVSLDAAVDPDDPDALYSDRIPSLLDMEDMVMTSELLVFYTRTADTVLQTRIQKVRPYLAARFTASIADLVVETETKEAIKEFQIFSEKVFRRHCEGREYSLGELAEEFSKSTNPTHVWSNFLAELKGCLKS